MNDSIELKVDPNNGGENGDNQGGKMPAVGPEKPTTKKRIRKGKVRIILKSGGWSTPLDPNDMDGRYGITQAYKGRINSFVDDLGGIDAISALQMELVKREAWASLWLTNFEMLYLSGIQVSDAEFNRYICLRNSSSRICEKLGLKRQERKVSFEEAVNKEFGQGDGNGND